MRVAQRPRRAYAAELAQFHSEDYVDFLARVTPDTAHVRRLRTVRHD